jgi:ABC-type uncharacterized transport system ATPase subunit
MKTTNASALIPPGGTIIEAQDLVLSFGETPALRDASLSVQRGEIVAVMGPSGSGKSTLLQVQEAPGEQEGLPVAMPGGTGAAAAKPRRRPITRLEPSSGRSLPMAAEAVWDQAATRTRPLRTSHRAVVGQSMATRSPCSLPAVEEQAG